jgi:eukaryotic-like serine/threonine-protein kinase
MPEDSKAGPTCRSAAELLAAIERSGILPEAQWRQVQQRFMRRTNYDSSLLAKQLIDEGTLTEFQARRLLKGNKILVFGRYALVDHLGMGARGRVFKARHRLLDRIVALKVMLPDCMSSETAVSRFFREMKIVGLLENPHVVRAIDADFHEGYPYIVMEYLEGSDLEGVFARRGPLPTHEVVAYMAQTARGLVHAHEKGVIHRDIKPTNLFLVKTGTVKILDLGCGELVGVAAQTGNIFDTDEGLVVGTTDFMSPEQIKDKPIDARTDLFSLGCTMYRLLTGAYAFPGLTREDRLVKRIRERHVPITEVRPGLPDSLVAIVDRLLALRPDDRFGSAAEVAETLEALNRPGRRPEEITGAKPGAEAGTAAPAESDAPLNRSVIEAALRPARHRAAETPGLRDRTESKRRSPGRLTSHRKLLEEEGAESGRDVHAKYRKELIQMNRAMADLRSTEGKDEAPSDRPTVIERIGEKIGDFLAEPSAGQIVICILLVLLVLAAAFAAAVG